MLTLFRQHLNAPQGRSQPSLQQHALAVYDSSNGNLYWNQNGNKRDFGTSGIFAVLDNNSALSVSNISLF